MPYIDRSKRGLYKEGMLLPSTPGELNYIFTETILEYLKTNGESYQTYNDVVGALECSKLEVYDRQARFYEDLKMRENGDVYPGRSSWSNLAWAGGFFEGEGCFYKHYYPPRKDGTKVFVVNASLTQKNKPLLDQFQNVVKCGIVYPDGKEGMYVWKSSKKGDAKKVFDLLQPYLGERRQKTFLTYYEEENKQEFRKARNKVK